MFLVSLSNSVQSLYSNLVSQQGKACTSQVEACHVYCVVTACQWLLSSSQPRGDEDLHLRRVPSSWQPTWEPVYQVHVLCSEIKPGFSVGKMRVWTLQYSPLILDIEE